MDNAVGQNVFFRWWGQRIVRFRWLVLLCLLMITSLAVYQIRTQLYVDNSPEAFMDSGGEDARTLEEFRDIFGRDDVLLLLIQGDVFTQSYLDKLKALHEELAALNVSVESLGERKADRDVLRGRGSTGNAAGVESTPVEGSGASDDFASMDDDFASMDDDFADMDGEGAGDSEWAGEEGGSIFDEVTSLLNVRKIRLMGDGALDVGELLDPMPQNEAELAALRETVLGNPEKGIPADKTIVGQVVSADGRTSALVVRTAFMSQPDTLRVYDAVAEVVASAQADGFHIQLAGMPAFTASMERLMLRDLRVLVLGSAVVIGFILFVMFVHPLGALTPLLVVMISALWTLGLMATLGVPMTAISTILPSFLICVGVADAVHLISVYRQGVHDGLASKEAAITAVADTGVPTFFTTLTTGFGLLSFQFASVDAIQEMGRFGAFGVCAAFFNTVTLLPVMLSFNKRSMMGADKKARMTLVQRLLDLCSNMSGRTVRGRRLTIAVAFVLLVVAVIGAMKLRVFHDPLSWIPPERPIRVSMALADEALGGASSVQLLIKAKGAEGVKDLELQKGIERLEAHARSYDDPYSDSKLVGNFRSVVDVVRETNRALMGGAPAEYRVPDTQQAVNDRFFMVESSGPDELSRLMTLDAQVTQVTIGLRWLEATQYRPFAEHMAVGVAEHIPTDKATVSMTGTVFSFLSTVSTLLWDVIRSFGVAFLVISVLMILLLRDVRLGLIAMVPNLVPIAYILGLMGYADIPVDMANLMIASIALGIAVDDTIHLLHHYKVHYDVHRDVEAAIQHALDHTGRALVVTSIILSLGFFVYLSSAMYNLQRFGALIGLTVILALLVDLIVAPALIRTVYKSSGNTSEDESATA